MSAQANAKLALTPHPKTDLRLLGTWKCDARRTLKEWRWKAGLSKEKRNRFKSIFGKLEVTYTRTKVISKLPHRGWESARCYRLLGADDTSVAIILYGALGLKDKKRYDRVAIQQVEELLGRPTIEHIHFEGPHYWIALGKNREFFKKIRGDGRSSL